MLLDQLSKWLVKQYMTLNQSLPVIGEKFFRLTYIENDGIAFGIPFGGRIFLTLLTIVAVIFLFYYILKSRNLPLLPRIALGMILGGALGNLTDRFLRGRVVDFLDFDFPDFIMPRWPVFNLADSSVTIGLIALIVYFLFLDKQMKSSSVEAVDAPALKGNGAGSGATSEEGTD